MKKIADRRGFTIIELLIALSILGLVLSLTISAVNWKDRRATDLSTELMGHFTSIELAASLYNNNTNTYPASLADASFVPSYLFPPKAPQGFDRAFGNATGGGGYHLGQQTGQTTTSNNGYFICAKVTVDNSSDARFVALQKVKEKTPTGKFFYNSTNDCTTTGLAPLSDMAAPSGTTTIYLAYWLTRD